ncbi:PIN/TRAM domain-containing protein [Clostridium sp. 1001271B_151109_B4]|uniref:PIN/TRAM domain-containing protein n=1 Tax=Clostridium sp. 1001271B_151109_B4 TaxID=2787148 RepID=UPI0018AB094A|nr:PIN/TRAM domain-containing protein [Clostridium sp. 1001271B_151109_B4]
MFKKGLKIIFTLLGLVVGYIIAEAILAINTGLRINIIKGVVATTIFYILCVLLFGIIFYFISPGLYKVISSTIDKIEKNIQRLSAQELIYGSAGLLIGLIIAAFIGAPLSGIFVGIHPAIGPIIFVLLELIAAILGAEIFIKKKDDISSTLLIFKRNNQREREKEKDKKSRGYAKGNAKVLDTSVIIDGRIFDLCQTGFIEGTLVIPSFVLDELRHISDSSDSLKRNRGRRGLDILNKIQKELEIETQIWEGDFKDIAEVDSKLLKLAQKLGGKVITNDFNLNKVAEFQGVPVLNINELANAIKPVVLPGEEMKTIVIKDGKESTQGIGYLDDGTMIVVEGGKKYIGEEILVIVTSVLQTSAGRMIFAKPKDN